MDQMMPDPHAFASEVDELEVARALRALKGRWRYDFSG
jgi:hypothetical protein